MENVGFDAFAFATATAALGADAPRDTRAGLQLLLKTLLDRGVALVLLASLLPVLLLLAAAVRLDSPGPILFRQPRIGLHDRTFLIWKFRTMHHAVTDAAGRRQTSRDDARVTRLGRTLRRLSLDELPQLLNVLRGDMSLVGPRPHTPTTAVAGRPLAEIVGPYKLRHRVKPGITGWAQINGSRGELRTDADVRRRVELDLQYIENWSVLLDLRILFLTAKREIFSSRAY